MSGIAGIWNLNGAPVDRGLLEFMTRYLAFRGPDAQESWTAGPVGLGHTLLRTTFESEQEKQPASLNGQIWITADARIDARADLAAKLRDQGEPCRPADPDCELILRAYRAWGEACVEHLLGDFAFAIWDARTQRLFCARDHFGVKPFFYVRVGDHFIFSNTLNCVRIHPAVSEELNERAIADYLLFDGNAESDTSSFREIFRLPAAHSLSVQNGSLNLRRYWTLPVDSPVTYRHANEYVEKFLELLETAVSDRLRIKRAGIFLSGGLDSGTVAAAARNLSARNGHGAELCAQTTVFDRLIPDQERHYSGLVAKKLGIPIDYFAADDYGLFDRADQPDTSRPEPFYYPFPALEIDQYRRIAARVRVVLTGDGGDPGLGTSLTGHLGRLLRGRRYGRLFKDVGRYLFAEGRFSRLYLRRRFENIRDRNEWKSLYPGWLNPEFEASLRLARRWEELNQPPEAPPPDAVRPEAYSFLSSSYWPQVFEGYDPAATHSAVEARHPLFDLRLVRFLIALPALPWAVDKGLFRVAGKERLPEAVRLRPKVPQVGSPTINLFQRHDSKWIDEFAPDARIHRYVERARVPKVHGEKNEQRLWMNLRPYTLNLWLRMFKPISYKLKLGGKSESIRILNRKEAV